MKNALLVLCILFSTTLFAQEEWGDVKKNVVTLKEIPPVWPGCEEGSAAKRDACFNNMLALLKDDVELYVPLLKKSFNKSGVEINNHPDVSGENV